ncbi:SRPBCC domain-containing protein [Cellulomonas bogoriensis]|uniref:ATPase n=1 Tax=Cellulomonas bogoriensis 69B4 = DSM 16987 TaxID=1386082 RepID=A0A0A0C0J7_9CELL|nr:SRPBCC domain-containing protein [Cellulomonas bogoriensis]KGM13696.1 ATPase [Cellulomonas bogoriensis 69B4 = DSM 16987]
MFDLPAEQTAIRRRVTREGEGPDEVVAVTVSRTFEADVEDVWDALTTRERLARWFSPVHGDLHVGGTYQIEGNAGGEVLVCERPSRVQVTFGAPDSIVDLHLAEGPDGTTVDLVHTMALPHVGSGAGALYVGPGWDGAVMGLGLHLRGVPIGDPLEMANSPAVVEFNAASIDRWVAVVEASGTADPQQVADAREAAVQQFTVVPE